MNFMSSRIDVATLLVRALRVSAAVHEVAIEALASIERPWASATFEGTRHELQLSLVGNDALRWLTMLPDAELPMRGHVVADLAIDTVDPRDDRIEATLTALLLAER